MGAINIDINATQFQDKYISLQNSISRYIVTIFQINFIKLLVQIDTFCN